MSATEANVSTSEEAVSGAFGMGMQYFELSANEQKQVIANASTLEEDEWRTLSDAMVQAYQANLVGVSDLMNANLTRSVSLATKVSLYQQINEFTEAEVSMDGEADSEEDYPGYETKGTPIPIVHKDFRVSERDLQTSRRMGNDLQTDGVAASTRVVSEKNEQLLFSGWTPTVRGDDGNTFTLHGYTTHPDRNTYTGSDWSSAGPGETNAGAIRTDIVGMLDALDGDNRTSGGFWLYLAPPQWREFRSTIDSNGDGNRTVRERILNTFDQEIGAVRRAEHLPDGSAVMVDPRQDVVQLVMAEDVQMIEWTSGSEMTNHYKIMSAMAPEIKSDAQGRSGIVHTTGI